MRNLARVLCAGAIAALPFVVAPAAAQQPTEIKVATLAPSALLWLHAIAKDQGFYAKHNVEIKELVAGSSPALLQAVSSGSVEAGISLGDLVIRAVDKGAPIVITGSILGKPVLRLIGGKGVTDIKQLKGATVTAGAVEGGTAELMRYQLKQAGVDPGTVKMVAITNSKDRVVALQNGQVKGALLIAPFDTLAIKSGMRVLDVYRKPWIETPLIVNKGWAAKNHAAAAGLTQALRDAANWIYDPGNKQKAIDILAAYTKTPKDVVADSYHFMIEDQKAVSPGLKVEEASLKDIVDIDVALGHPAPAKPFKLSDYYDPSFLDAK
jgi:ABC-type nitrate/sulfonate/bicarbonate transport system substrate-binding protein